MWTYNINWGGYSTMIQQPADFFFHLPKNFDIKRGAPLFCAVVTTFYPIKKYLKKDMNTAVLGIHLAIQFLHKLGYNVTSFTTNKNKEKMIKDLGADNIIISVQMKIK